MLDVPAPAARVVSKAPPYKVRSVQPSIMTVVMRVEHTDSDSDGGIRLIKVAPGHKTYVLVSDDEPETEGKD